MPPIFEPGATSNPIDHLAGAFHGLSISNPSTPATVQTDPGFVGGFNLAGASSSAPALGSPSRPPAMPVPFAPYPGQQSLTMQFALRPDSSDFVSIPLPPFKPQGPSGQHSGPSSPILGPSTSVGLSPSTSPTRPSILSTPTKHRTNSSISSASRTSTPSGKTSQTRCAGITKAGKRCTRQVKTDLADDDAEDEEENVPRFCFQHTTEILVPSGYYARKDGAWVTFKGKIRCKYTNFHPDVGLEQNGYLPICNRQHKHLYEQKWKKSSPLEMYQDTSTHSKSGVRDHVIRWDKVSSQWFEIPKHPKPLS